MVITILFILFLVLFVYWALSVIYLLLLSVWGRCFYRQLPFPPASLADVPYNRIAVLVPSFKEDGIILSTAQNLLELDYPATSYGIYIIADSLQEETLRQLRALPIHVVEVSFTKSTKTKSLNEAFSRITAEYDVALICDADNMLASDFLQKINYAFVRGARAVQGRRVAKNLDTSFAILDACSEGINNNIFRKGTYAMGLSSAVIGSGMAFEYGTIKAILGEIQAVGGFDKILQLKVVEQGNRIHYLENALIFDEKVDSSHAFQQQRTRWVSSQFIYLRRFFVPACRHLLKGQISYFNLAVVNNLVLPRAFLMAGGPVMVVAGWLFGPFWGELSLAVLLGYGLALLLALPRDLINKDLFRAVLSLPRAIWNMVGALFQLKKAKQQFIHTVHTKTEVTNPAFKNRNK